MPLKRASGFIFLLYWTLYTDFAVSTPTRFADTLKSFTAPNSKFHNFAIDQDSGDVYLGDNNALYHLSSDLELKQKVTTGPLEDAHNCPMPPYPCDRERVLTDNRNRLLNIIYFSGSPPILLLCGTVYNGLCQVRPMDNLEEVRWIHPHNDSLGYNQGLAHNKAMIFRGQNDEWTLFTPTFDYYEKNTPFPVFSSKVLVKENDDYYFRYPLQNDPESSMFKPKDTKLTYVWAEKFVHDGYAYFLTRFNRNGKVYNKLLRFCIEDTTFQSYAELSLICRHKNSSEAASYLIHYGDSPSSDDKSLYVGYYDGTEASILCAFPMTTIVDAFNEAPRDCNRETFGRMCDVEEKKENGSICGSIGTPNIVRDALSVHSFAKVKPPLIAIASVKHNNDIVVISLSRDGSVYRVSLSTGEIISKNSVANKELNIYRRIFLDREGEHIYFWLINIIFKYPVTSCGVHDTYTLCLTRGQKDPLGCGWCEGRCTTQEECPHPDSFHREFREKPKLYGMYPHKGPTSGGTKVTIFGENLGYGIEKAPVFSVERRVCHTLSVDEDKVTCITGNVTFFNEDLPESIALRIGNEIYGIDRNSSSSINITGVSQTFEYTPDPEITHMQHGFTTISGLLNVTATGTHFDSVQHPKIILKLPPTNQFSDILEDCWSNPESNGTLMTCRTPPLPKRLGVDIPTSTDPILTHVAFIMDGVQKLRDFNINQEEMSRLWYYPDPVFKEVSNIGNNTLAITGNHLNLKKLSGFQIRLGDDYFCSNVSFSVENITCLLPATLQSNSNLFIAVEVLLGYTWHQIGYITVGKSEDGRPGYPTIESLTNLSSNWWIVFVLVLVCVITVAFTCFKHRKKRSYKRDRPTEGVRLHYIDTAINEEGFEMPPLDSKILALLEEKNLVIPKSWLVIGENVGAGQFGCVFEGLLQRPEETEDIRVAIKTLHEHSWSNVQTVESFLKEALIMKDFDHSNVLSLLGVCCEGSAPSIVLPFMENGDLCSYIRDKTKVILVNRLLQFAIDVASGMAYLGKKKFVHRDLAARNCILDSSLAVKVADFGLSRDVYTDDYYRCQDRTAKLPCRWMAPESLENQVYSMKTDVWSYGVLLWELMTRGNVPYSNVANWDMRDYVQSGHRLDQPEHCPKSLYMVMLACWNKESKRRPSFYLLHEYITRIRRGILERQQQQKKKKGPSEKVPAQHTGYYNSRELYLRKDGLVLNKEILKESFNKQNEYIDMRTHKESWV